MAEPGLLTQIGSLVLLVVLVLALIALQEHLPKCPACACTRSKPLNSEIHVRRCERCWHVYEVKPE